MHEVTQTEQGYWVIATPEAEDIAWGAYATQEDAKEAARLLVENDWEDRFVKHLQLPWDSIEIPSGTIIEE